MDMMQQSEEVAREIERFRCYHCKVGVLTTLRGLAPQTVFKLLWSETRIVWSCLRECRKVDFSHIRRTEFELLCNEDEKTSPYYRIIHSDPYNTLHALSERLDAKFPAFNWLALEHVTRIRIGQIPRLGFAGIWNAMRVLASLFTLLGAFLAALGAYAFLEFRLPYLGMPDDLIAWVLASLTAILVVYLIFSVFTHMARKRLQRTLGVLGYMAIRVRQGELPSARE